jgi:hypothetical protein
MKKLICILFIFVNFVCFSQTTMFNNTYTNFYAANLANVIITNNGYVCLGGGRGLSNPAGNLRIVLLGTDDFGNILWEKSYGDENYYYYHGIRNSLIENTDGCYSLAGHRTNPENEYRACMLTKFDQNFDTLWTKKYFDNPDFTVFYNHIQTSDGGYALVGSNDEDDPDGDVLLVKTDNEGNMQWYKKYGTSGYDSGFCIIEAPDSGFLIGGKCSLGSRDGYLIKTDSEGNQEWTKHYGNSLYSDGTIYTIIHKNSYYYIPLSSYVTDPISGSFYNRRYSIVKLDEDFNEVWNNIYGVRAENSGLGTITVTENGNIFATISDDQIGGLMHISPNGDSIWTRYYEPEGSIGENGLLSIKQTEDNGFIIAGVAYDPQVMWLVKTDSCGCITEDCECGGSLTEQVIANREIEVYPNPANDILHFNLPENTIDVKVEIYDNLGRLIITNKFLGWEKSVDVSELKPGSYFVRIISAEEQWSEWFVKE